ncbi:hypothetical protein C823_003314 [Eubacterium plexicaudatum ASF492]|uniref:Carrier domain-containing protein n=1 Tax=Eubacterium plexicaudatum ASF492 TaxID=1235802 RepID=N2AMT1_9FIRM|nr:hypothetical protein C823_003314 [Eubacterium plexicaudatum ASF492]
MNREDVLKKIDGICKDVFDDETLIVTEQTSPEDIEDWDSLTNIQLICDVENVFGIKFTMEEVQKFTDIGELVEIILKKIVI